MRPTLISNDHTLQSICSLRNTNLVTMLQAVPIPKETKAREDRLAQPESKQLSLITCHSAPLFPACVQLSIANQSLIRSRASNRSAIDFHSLLEER